VRGGEDVLGRPEGEGVRRGGGAQPRVARHGQPWPRPDPEVRTLEAIALGISNVLHWTG